ncbi:uncharacterized protein LOC136082342 isoform X1 [Hydra vulgaris]|uniref:Uncharacterized protein LOC136082342 isoform X1 n=2 Tax=Hydra vulgaris TaxID=6087 RepID=A0ABM4C727_HYDVU
MNYFKKLFYWLLYNKEMDPLPHSVIFLLSAQYFLESLTSSSVFSYLPQLVKSFGASEENAGRDAGWIAASLFVARICFGLIWGYSMGKIDPKKLIVILGVFQIISTFLFGLSRSFYWALVTRFLQGTFTATGLVSKVIVIHQSNDTNIALAFSILFGAYTLSVIVGPSFAGFLVFLAEQHPKSFKKDGFFGKYEVFLPNLIIALCMVLSTSIIVKYLPSCKIKQNLEPVDVVNNENLNLSNENQYLNISFEENEQKKSTQSEVTQLIPLKNNFVLRAKKRLVTSSFLQPLMNKSCMCALVLYALFCIVGIGLYDLITIYFATSIEFGGLAMSSSQIGLLLMIASVVEVAGSVTLLPKLLRRFGAKKSFICWIAFCGCLSPFIPAFVKISNNGLRWSSLATCVVAINIVINGCFLSVNMFVANSVLPEYQGAVNGLGMSISSIGRSIGPALFGNAYSWSLSNMKSKRLSFPFNQYFAFFLLTAFCFVSAVYAHFFISKSLNRKKTSLLKEKLVVRVSHYLYAR